MLMEKLAKDVAEIADAKIKTDLKYTPEKTDPIDDYAGARKLLLPNSTYVNAPYTELQKARTSMSDAKDRLTQADIQSKTKVVTDASANEHTDLVRRLSKDVVQPYLQKRYDAYADKNGLPKINVRSNPIVVADDGSYDFPGAGPLKDSRAYYSPYNNPFDRAHIAHNTSYYTPDTQAALADMGVVGHGSAAVEDDMNHTIAHEMAHADPKNPYSSNAIIKNMPPIKTRSFIDRAAAIADVMYKSTWGRILPEHLISPEILKSKKFNEMMASNLAANHRFGTKDHYYSDYFAVPGRAMDELRSDYYGWVNKLRGRPLAALGNPLPRMDYAKIITRPIIEAFSDAMSATDPRVRNEQIQKGRHYISRMLYPHLGDPAQIRTDDLKE